MSTTKQKKIFLAIFGLLFLLVGMVMGDEEEEDKLEKFINKKRVNAAYVIAGFNALRLGPLNNYLTANDCPNLAESYFTYGFGGHLIHDKFVLGFELQRSFGKKRISSKDFNTFLSLKYTTLNIGYLIYSQKGLMTYPAS
ncbi:MAG: hypothetical protein MUF15_21500 [Acidobacteria bacterium]|nr:hypothetical protein [Acidobacteriota bacterium]